ncbi:MAG: hypothetical protein FWC41_13460, partial [Firmicutes bacterium]|nr:hypothetical protein [Bacillota bacterium]
MAKILANRSYDTITNGYMLPSPLVNSKLPDGKKVTNDVIINNPREFEVYFIALELCDFKDVLQDFLIFPVNPTSLTKIEPVSTNIKKTFGGISVTKTDEFIPQSITLQGTFGRSFMTLGGEAFYGISGDRITENALQKMFQKNIKTGFGVTKILQDICKKSRGYSTDDLRPNILYFHNHAFSESYMCEVRSIRFFQTIETNMIWNYELELDIVGIVDFKRKFSLTGLTEKVKNYQFESTSRRIFGE